jgi:hypothetical protein
MTAGSKVWARCDACAHVFHVCTLPLPVAAFARQLRRARCPACNAATDRLKVSDGSAAWTPRENAPNP